MKKIFTPLLLLLLFVFISCNPLIENLNERDCQGNRVYIEILEPSNEARLIKPVSYSVSDIGKLVVYSRTEDEEYNKIFEASEYRRGKTYFSHDSGTYDFKIVLYGKNAKPFAVGELKDCVIGAESKLSFKTDFLESGAGSFNVDFSWSNKEKITSARYTLTSNLDYSTYSEGTVETIDTTSNSYNNRLTVALNDVDCGEYFLSVDFLDSKNRCIGKCADFLIIKAGYNSTCSTINLQNVKSYYDVTLDVEDDVVTADGSALLAELSFRENETLTLPVLKRNGYVFRGWLLYAGEKQLNEKYAYSINGRDSSYVKDLVAKPVWLGNTLTVSEFVDLFSSEENPLAKGHFSFEITDCDDEEKLKSLTSVFNTNYTFDLDLSKSKLEIIPSSAFKGYYKESCLSELILPNTLKEISNWAFSSNKNLRKVSLPDSIGIIDGGAFENCTLLEEVVLPKQLKKLASSAFEGCSSLSRIDYSKVSTLYSLNFEGCTSLKEIVVPENIEKLEYGALRNCPNLETVYWNASVWNPKVLMNSSKENGVKVIFGNNIKILTCTSSYILRDDVYITEVEFENGSKCEEIGGYAFSGIKTLVKANLPSSVKIIGDQVFRDDSALSEITIPENVESIGKYAFYGTTGINRLIFNAIKCNSINTDENVFEQIGFDNGFDVVIGKSATCIPNNLFAISTADKIKSISFEDGSACEKIGDYAFANCSSVRLIVIPNTVTAIGKGSFKNLSSVEELVIPESVSSINYDAFKGMRSLKSLYFKPRNCKISGYIFDGCGDKDLGMNVRIGAEVSGIKNNMFVINSDASDYDKNKIYINKLVFDDGCVCSSIGDYAFASTNIKEIHIPASVMYIGKNAFSNCSSSCKSYFEKAETWYSGYYSYSENGIKWNESPYTVSETTFQNNGANNLYLKRVN